MKCCCEWKFDGIFAVLSVNLYSCFIIYNFISPSQHGSITVIKKKKNNKYKKNNNAGKKYDNITHTKSMFKCKWSYASNVKVYNVDCYAIHPNMNNSPVAVSCRRPKSKSSKTRFWALPFNRAACWWLRLTHKVRLLISVFFRVTISLVVTVAQLYIKHRPYTHNAS